MESTFVSLKEKEEEVDKVGRERRVKMKLRKNLLRFGWLSKEAGGATIGTQRDIGGGGEVSSVSIQPILSCESL